MRLGGGGSGVEMGGNALGVCVVVGSILVR